MRTLASLKREALGKVLTMTRNDWIPAVKLIGVPRKIVQVTTIGMYFEGGSYMDFPKAKYIRLTPGRIVIDMNHDGLFTNILEYTYE